MNHVSRLITRHQASLTANIVDPHRALQKVNVVDQNKQVCGLIQQKSVPRLRNVAGVIENCHSDDLLRDDDGNPCTYGDPGEYVGRPTAITL